MLADFNMFADLKLCFLRAVKTVFGETYQSADFGLAVVTRWPRLFFAVSDSFTNLFMSLKTFYFARDLGLPAAAACRKLKSDAIRIMML
jgi:hypothetical protein